jgi:hypothetical protein
MQDRQERLTLTLIDDRTANTTSTTTTSTLVKVSRLDSSDASTQTKVDQVIEQGTNGIVGGVVHLASGKGSLSRQMVDTTALGLLTAKKQNPTTGQTTTWGYYDLANAAFDYARLLADAAGNVWGAKFVLGAELTNTKYTAKVSGNTMEAYDFVCKHTYQVNGYAIGKAYQVQASDVTAGNIPLSSTFFGALNTATAGAEIPVQNNPPFSGVMSAQYATGRINFHRTARYLSAQATINGTVYGAGSIVRYRENQGYVVTAASLGTAGAQTALTATVAGTNYLGGEIIAGLNIVVDVGGANQETCAVTSVSGNTLGFTTTKTHATTGVVIALAPTSGYCVYNQLTGKMIFGDILVASDTIRVLFHSFDTSSVPKTIATTSFDTVAPGGTPARLTPVSISNNGVIGIQDASMDIGSPRKEVQGIGEDEARFGTAGVPAISYSATVMARGNEVLQALSGGGDASNVYSPDFAVRYQNQNPVPFTISIKSPLNNQKTVVSVQGGQPVLNYEESGNANADTTIKLSGQDMSGVVTISATS